MISYAPLMATLHKKKLSKTDLQEMTKMSPSTLAKIGKDEHVSLKVIDSICSALDCNIENVIKYEQEHKIKILKEIEGEIPICELLEEMLISYHEKKYGEKCIIMYRDEVTGEYKPKQ